jgi:hypothetical protein
MIEYPLIVTNIVVEYLCITRTHQNDPVGRLLIDLCVRRPGLREVSRTLKDTRPDFWADLQRAISQHLEDTISEKQVELWQADADDYGSVT